MRAHRPGLALVLALAMLGTAQIAPGDSASSTIALTAATPRLVLGSAMTDNYKTFGGPQTTDDRTSLMVDSVQVGGTTYQVDTSQVRSAPAPGCVGTGRSLRTTCIIAEYDDEEPLGLPLTGAGGEQAYLTYRLPDNHGGGNVRPYYRVFNAASFGLFVAVNRATFVGGEHTPLSTTLQLWSAGTGALLAETALSYRYDTGIAGLGQQYLEHGGPSGRWYVDDAATPLNWASGVSFAPTTVTPDVARPVAVTTTDIAGLPVPGFRQSEGGAPVPIALTWNPTGAGRPSSANTLAAGSATRRDISVTLPAGSYQVHGAATCPSNVCVRDTTMPVTGSTTITAAAASVLQPDVSVRGTDGSWLGEGTINSAGADQTLEIATPASTTATVVIAIRHDGSESADLLLAGVPFSPYADAAHTWHDAGVDVTALVDSGSYELADLAPGASRVLTLRITPSTSAIGATRAFYLHAIHRVDGTTAKDVAGVRVTITTPSNPTTPSGPSTPSNPSSSACPAAEAELRAARSDLRRADVAAVRAAAKVSTLRTKVKRATGATRRALTTRLHRAKSRHRTARRALALSQAAVGAAEVRLDQVC
jgi:hypothetical protein